MMQISKEHLFLFILGFSVSVFCCWEMILGSIQKILPLVPFFPQICILHPKRISNYGPGVYVWESALHRLRGHKYESRSLYALWFVLLIHGIAHHATHANEVGQREFPCRWLRCAFESKKVRLWGKSSNEYQSTGKYFMVNSPENYHCTVVHGTKIDDIREWGRIWKFCHLVGTGRWDWMLIINIIWKSLKRRTLSARRACMTA